MHYVTLDIETTGTANDCEITEVTILNNSTLELVTWIVKIKHPERCSKDALRITNKTVEELMNRGRYIEEVMPEIKEFILGISQDPDDICAIGHNVAFDRRFLENTWKQFYGEDSSFPINYWLCTLAMSKRYVKNILNISEKTSFKLVDMIKLANLPEVDNMHNSKTDTKQTFLLYRHMSGRGLANTEFIKLSPSLLENLGGKKGGSKIKKTAKPKATKKSKSKEANAALAAAAAEDEDLSVLDNVKIEKEDGEDCDSSFEEMCGDMSDIDADDYAAP